MRTRWAAFASQLSRVSFHPRGPANTQTMSFALIAADIFGTSVALFDFSAIGCSMFTLMKRDPTWKPLGALTTRIAARLMARREAEIQEGSAAEDRREPRMDVEEKRPRGDAARCPASRRMPGGDGGAPGAGGNSSERCAAGAWGGVGGSAKIIQFAAVGGRAAGPLIAPLSSLQGGPAELHCVTWKARRRGANGNSNGCSSHVVNGLSPLPSTKNRRPRAGML